MTMFWACFTWLEISPCYCWPKEIAKMAARYQELMDNYNKAHEEEDREAWELETRLKRLSLAGKGGRKPTWKYTAKTGKQVRQGKGGIDWIRYQQEVLLPLFLPFIERLQEKYGPVHIVQEDNASPHIARWNRQLWDEAGFTVLEWLANSPDLNAIEPVWARLKQYYRKKKLPNSRVQLEKCWSKRWKELVLEQLQRCVERIQGNVKWVIRLAGGNEYREGSVPDPLPPGEEEPGYSVWREWSQKSKAEQRAELEADVQRRFEERYGLSWGELEYLIRGRRRREQTES